MDRTMKNTDKADRFFEQDGPWQAGLNELRRIVHTTGLNEEVKWGHPCYTHRGGNVVMIIATKGYFGLWFHKGALLADAKKLLSQSDTLTQGLRQMRFTDVAAVRKATADIKAYLHEAALLEEQGVKVIMKAVSAADMPAEWKEATKATPGLQKAFNALTPGRQRAYAAHFGNAKQSTTRASRIARSVDRILAGKGLDAPA